MHLPPADVLALPAASAVLVTGRALLKGFDLRETSGTTAATVRLWDSSVASAAGPQLTTIQLNPAESTADWFPESGKGVERGVYFQLVSGAVEGSVSVIPESLWPEGWESYSGTQD